jgi:hypothetical protein
MSDLDYTPITVAGTPGVDFAAMLAAADPYAGGYGPVITVVEDTDPNYAAALKAAGQVSYTPITTAGVSAT